MIKPTIGRKVWYSPTAYDLAYYVKLGEQYFDATIVYVHGDRRVNLQINDHRGVRFCKADVPLLQDDDAPPPGGGHATWMPYQKTVSTGQQAPTLHEFVRS